MAKEVIYRKDYKAPDFLIDKVYLEFNLGAEQTFVKSRIEFRKDNKDARDCVLFADDLTFVSVSMNGELLSVEDYILSDSELIIKNAPDEFVLEIENTINPSANTKLEGLYASSGVLCSQCEPEGFRRITYYPDRSDVMAIFKVKLIANKEQYPVLLSNGNLIESGDLEEGKHYAIYEDPFRKPSYLFAVVAGKLDSISDEFTTMSGQKVDLHVYCNPGNAYKCGHAMESLKKAMKWDEEAFGREYDLNIFNIVIVDDFNAGAMENKSLNVFNSSCTLADPKTTTDRTYGFVERVVGHEYFHNWSGDRVTCQSWFDLTLKEGLNTFREQSFCQDMQNRDIQRIGDVILIRNSQIQEDQSPMAHPIRPDSYMEINNFYTRTVYQKGAEVIRMIQTILGKEKFRTACDFYFEKMDGTAASCEDFVKCMEESSGVDLKQFRLWYSQAGTPVVTVKSYWDKQSRKYTLTVSQKTLPTANQEDKFALHIPMKTSILNHEGQEMDLIIDGENLGKETVLELREDKHVFVFEEVNSQPCPSLFRGFSAPITLKTDLNMEDYAFLMANDTDGFNRWDSAQKFAMDIILKGINDPDKFKVPSLFINSFKKVLEDTEITDEFKALILGLPSEQEIYSVVELVNPDDIHSVRRKFTSTLSVELNHEFMHEFGRTNYDGEYDLSKESVGRRSLHNVCLAYLCTNKEKGALHLAEHQYFHANNMTDEFAALSIIVNKGDEKQVDVVLDNFYETHKDDAIVMNKWFAVQAMADKENIIDTIRNLKQHEKFSMTNPNVVRSLISTFASYNLINFHKKDGSGYELVADFVIELNDINPHGASDVIDSMCDFSRLDKDRQKIIVSQLKRIANIDKLSPNLKEKIDNALKTV